MDKGTYFHTVHDKVTATNITISHGTKLDRANTGKVDSIKVMAIRE